MRISLVASVLVLSASLHASTLTPVANDLIVPRTAAARILIPAAGDVPGANGTHFRSDIHLVNLRNLQQNVELRWLPQTGGTPVVRTITIPANSGVASENFVGDFMATNGLGSIEIIGVTAQGQPDGSALLHAAARIWTPEPDNGNGLDDEGTMSQTFPAIVLPSSSSATKSVFGLRRGAQYRLNVGISNPNDVSMRFRVTTYVLNNSPETVVTDVVIGANSMNQFNVTPNTSGLIQVIIQSVDGSAPDWQAWASSVDNESGDAWSQMAVANEQ
jgi:hypothetical protein